MTPCSRPNHLLNAQPPNIISSPVRIPTCDFVGGPQHTVIMEVEKREEWHTPQIRSSALSSDAPGLSLAKQFKRAQLLPLCILSLLTCKMRLIPAPPPVGPYAITQEHLWHIVSAQSMLAGVISIAKTSNPQNPSPP